MPKPVIPLFNFAWHQKGWLEEITKIAKPEPWGHNHKILELYLRANFEIAKSQGKVHEDKTRSVAFWRAGSLVNMTSDPIWLVYKANRRQADQYWEFEKPVSGDTPLGMDRATFELKYTPPEFQRDWQIHFEQGGIKHMLGDNRNRSRLKEVFSKALGDSFNEFLGQYTERSS